MTNTYTYHIEFESAYDEVPVIRIYDNYLNEDGDLETDYSAITGRVAFSNDDCDFAIRDLKLNGIEELWVDEHFAIEDIERQTWISPEIKAWVKEFAQNGDN